MKFLLFSALLNLAYAKNYSDYKLYKDVKDQIKFPAFQPEQRVQAANASYIMLQTYVNRAVKIKDFGIDVDPIPKIQNILANAEKMTDLHFHTQMSNLYLSLHDKHSYYVFPAPYRCYSVHYPFSFDVVDTGKIVVSSIIPETKFLYPGIDQQVRIGDEIVSFNGKAIQQFISDTKNIGRGANPDAEVRTALDFLRAVPGDMHILPDSTNATFIFTRNGNQFSVNVPAASKTDDFCLAGNVTAGITPASRVDNSCLNTVSHNNSQPKTHRSARLLSISVEGGGGDPADELDKREYLNHTVYNYGGKKMGIIKLNTMTPSSMPRHPSIEDVLKFLKSLLVNEFKETDCLLFDVRSNGGGEVDFVDRLVESITDKIPRMSARILNNDINKIVVHGYKSKTPIPTSMFDNATGPFTHEFQFNKVIPSTPVYNKPIGIFTDADCYSGCDVFAAQMQDFGIATIFGVDATTGAGGASPLSQVNFMNAFNGSSIHFPELTFGMSVSWAQIVRKGKYDGQLIENAGVKSEFVFKPTVQDLIEAQTPDVLNWKSWGNFSYLNSIVEKLAGSK